MESPSRVSAEEVEQVLNFAIFDPSPRLFSQIPTMRSTAEEFISASGGHSFTQEETEVILSSVHYALNKQQQQQQQHRSSSQAVRNY